MQKWTASKKLSMSIRLRFCKTSLFVGYNNIFYNRMAILRKLLAIEGGIHGSCYKRMGQQIPNL